MKLITFMLVLSLLVSTFGICAENTYIFKDAPVKSCLMSIFEGTGEDYVIASDISGNVNLTVSKEVPIDTLLSLIAKSNNLTIFKEDKIYFISTRKNELTIVLPENETVIADIESQKVIEKINLNYADCTEIASIFGVQVANNRNYNISSMGNMGNMGNNFGSNNGYFGASSNFPPEGSQMPSLQQKRLYGTAQPIAGNIYQSR